MVKQLVWDGYLRSPALRVVVLLVLWFSSTGLGEAARPLRGTSSLFSHGSQSPFVASTLGHQPVSVPASRSLSDIPQIPWVVQVRGHLDSIARLMSGDQYIGRGSRQRNLVKSQYSNPYKVSEYGRENAIELFNQFLDSSPELISQVHFLSGKTLVCHCRLSQRCHADALIRKFRELHPEAFDRNRVNERAPSAEELNLLAAHRQEPPSDDGSSADHGVPQKNSGWVGHGCPLQVGIGYTSRDYCDGQGLASPGRWPVEHRRYPSSQPWEKIKERFSRYTEFRGTPELLMALALGKVEGCPFDATETDALKFELIEDMEKHELDVGRKQGDREELPIDFRFLGLLLEAAEDPEVGLGDFAQGVCVGPGSRMPRLPALYRAKRRWRLASQADPQSLSQRGRSQRRVSLEEELRYSAAVGKGGVRRSGRPNSERDVYQTSRTSCESKVP